MSDQTNIQIENSSLSEKLKERRQEQKEQQNPKKSDDSDLGYELHEELERQQNDNTNAWRFG